MAVAVEVAAGSVQEVAAPISAVAASAAVVVAEGLLSEAAVSVVDPRSVEGFLAEDMEEGTAP